MTWFHKNKKQKTPVVTEALLPIEIIADQKAKAEVIAQAKEVNKQLNNILIENGFTLKIYLAAGGSHPQKQKGTH